MKLRIGRALAGTVAVTAATVMATTGTASADIPPGIDWDHTFTAPGVKVYVEEYGDFISVCDSKANGHAARVYVAGYYDMKASGGSGTCETHRARDGGKYNLRENDRIYLYYRGDDNGNHGSSYFNDH
ncbi:hypothetical protein ACN3XK_01030 [Actinomadura welshii]